MLETLIKVSGEKFNLQENKKCASPDMQNVMMQIFHDDVMRNVVKKTQANEFFCVLADEGTDSSNAELLSLVSRQVTNDLEVKEYFICFHRLENIKSEHIAKAIKASRD